MTRGVQGGTETRSWRRAHLELTQANGPTPSHTLGGDLLVLTSSWERRCLEVSNASHSGYARAAVIRFSERGVSGRRDRHDEELQRFAGRVSDELLNLGSWSSSAVQEWRDALVDLLVDVRAWRGRPIDVVADMTCLPKYFALALIGFSISSGTVRSLRLFYAEGRYAPADSNASLAPDHAFTTGEWEAVQVPYLEGRHKPDRKMGIVASIGFETFQARKLIRAYEADRHVLVAPHPGFSAEYEERSEAEVRALSTALDLPSEEVHRSPAGDAIRTAELVLDVLDGERKFNDVGLCLGTKPHAVGFGLAALLRPQLTLVCRLPDSYAETETPPTGKSWTFTFDDLSAASSGTATRVDGPITAPRAAVSRSAVEVRSLLSSGEG